MIKTITNKEEYIANPTLESDVNQYSQKVELFGKEWLMHDDFWMHHIHVKVTDRCDAHCPFCIEKHSHIKENGPQLLHNLNDMLWQLDDQGIDGTVSITGGEPSLCGYSGTVVDILKTHKRFLNINTNFHNMIYSSLDPDWLNISRHIETADTYTGLRLLDLGQLQSYKADHPTTKIRIQCVLHPYGLQSLYDILKFLDTYGRIVWNDDFSFRRLINTSDGERQRDLFTEFKEYLFEHADFIEQTIQDYYIYEIYELNGKRITISFSDMALLKSLEQSEPDNLLREIIVHPDGLISGSWYRDKKIIHA